MGLNIDVGVVGVVGVGVDIDVGVGGLAKMCVIFVLGITYKKDLFKRMSKKEPKC